MLGVSFVPCRAAQIKKRDPGYQADSRKALRLAGHPQREYRMLLLAWECVDNFELYD